ncbi:diguanylate cyclase domain-containing protein [Mitsuaria sp. BK037]|uniref:bifunctional diguanylate cyclase/phosphodiesterase n=1 Tax=Mitsuaria sp. BK037 TaxID=2587122 RepID=UPI00160C4032|nr:diguanylate cyclase [Mitsuaria sp. BK037]MBB3280935.1 diguanylate cyclase (GGDEF)-like protein/PAS domain S-box-containing protein [Mitsuaria sp. BK037]
MPLTDPQLLVDGAAKRRRRMTAWLVGANLTVALVLAALVWHVLDASHRTYATQARDVAEGLAAVAQLNVEAEIGRVDAVLRATGAELERLMAAPGGAPDAVLNEVLHARFGLLHGIEAFRAADASGEVRWGTRLPAGAPARVHDRDYFLQARALAEPATLVTGPLVSRVSGNWVVAFVRPLVVRGRFAGVLYVSVGVDHFRHLFERYELAPLDAMTLRRDDLRLVARIAPGSPVQGEVGDTKVSARMREMLAANPRQGSVVTTVSIDGRDRTSAYRALDHWPFVVYAGVNNERFFKPWREQAWTVASLAALAWLLVALATWHVRRANRREEQAMTALAEQGKRIQALMRVSADGIHIIDGRGRLVEMSDSFAEMLKSTRASLMGRHVGSWDVNQDEAAINAWLAKIKAGDRQRVDVQHRRDDGQVIDVELQLSVTEIRGELYVFSSGRDVTQARRLQREQAAMLDSDLVAMAKIEHRTITWRNRALERILGYGPGELQGAPARVFYWDDAQYEEVGRQVYSALAEHGHYRSQIRMRSKGGEAVWVDFGAAPLSATEIFAMAVDITPMKAAHEHLAHAAFHDALTQLPNRVLLHDRIEQALGVARRERKRVAICYLDLDGFKAVNDEHGHDAGDQLLETVARRLLAHIRPLDTAARLGGDEFVLVLTCVDGDDWRPVLARVVDAIGEPVALSSGAIVAVGATVGVAVFSPDDTTGAQELIERADHEMLRGKRDGKGRVVAG